MSSIVTKLRGGSELRAWIVAVLLLSTAPVTWAGVTVALTAPTDAAIVNPIQGNPVNITLDATASANQGYTVSKVEFFHGSTLIGTDTASPYSFNWTNVQPGSYALTAKATAIKKNGPNQTATSASVNIIVNALPVVTMTSPVNEFTTLPIPPPGVTLSATATDSDGTIAKVEFWQQSGSTLPELIATVTTPPYSVVWNIPPPYQTNGSPNIYAIWAEATDNRGGVALNESKGVLLAPTIALTSPPNGSTYAAPATITLNALVNPTDFPIAKMQFYNGTTLLGEDLTSPYSFSWDNVGVGTYSLTAVAVEFSGPSQWPSSPVNVTVTAASVEPKLHFIHVDHLNTPRLVADAAGATVWQWDQTEPFGNNPANENPGGAGVFDMPLRYPGQYFDKESNLHYNYFRDYDPNIGRYVESDPIGLGGGINAYAYANNSALLFLDDYGLKPYIFRVIVGGGVSLPGITGQVFNLAVIDPIAGQTCNYTVSCIGAGASFKGTSAFSGGGMPVTWDDGQECSNCRKFEGHGMAGTIAFQIGPIGYTPVDWLEVPNGPRLDFSGWAGGGVNIGGGTYACHFLLR